MPIDLPAQVDEDNLGSARYITKGSVGVKQLFVQLLTQRAWPTKRREPVAPDPNEAPDFDPSNRSMGFRSGVGAIFGDAVRCLFRTPR